MMARHQMPGAVRCLRVPEWPVVDQARWEQALAAGDALDPGGVAAGWKPSSVRKAVAGYGRFLSYLLDDGQIDPDSTPESRVTRERLRDYLAYLQHHYRGHTPQCRIQELGDMMRALAPQQDWGWVLRAAGRLRAEAVPAREKLERLRPIEELVALGFETMVQAERATGISLLRRALRYRDGLLVALLGYHPMRLRSIAALEVGNHLTERGARFWIKLSDPDTKTGEPYEGRVDGRLAEALRSYLQRFRPVLLASGRSRPARAITALWIAKGGAAASAQTIYRRTCRLTASNGKPSVSPHMFRTCAHTSVAIRKPESIEIMPAVLGHSTSRMGEKHYNIAGKVEASRAYGAMLEELYGELTPKRPRPKVADKLTAND